MQTSYSYNTPIGAAGGIVDLAPHYIRSFTNEAANGAMAFGLGVVTGANDDEHIGGETVGDGADGTGPNAYIQNQQEDEKAQHTDEHIAYGVG